MKDLTWVTPEDSNLSQKRILFTSAIAAILFEMILLTVVGWHEHWLAHPQKTNADDARFIDAQVYQVPTEARLVEEKKAVSVPQKKEAVLSKSPDKGISQKTQPAVEEENQTEAGPKMAATHGPVALYAPHPILPTYLQDKELKTSVVIDFYVNAQGIASPRLVGSSGNEELDAIAIEAVKKWQFRAAEKDHKPIESKVRLRIMFEVK